MATILLTHAEEARSLYYGDEALARLRELGQVRLNETGRGLSTAQLIELARGCQIIVSDRITAGPAAVFDQLRELVAFVRCAVDIRNVDVGTASRHGILVTRATPGFAAPVAELGLGLMVDLARGITDAVAVYRTGQAPTARIGRQLKGSTVGIIGYGVIGQHLAGLAKATGMTVLASDPYKTIDEPGVVQVSFEDLLARSDFVVCLAVVTEETENLIDRAALARMRPSAYFINLSRGNLVDEAALAAALEAKTIAGAAMDVGRAPDQMPSLDLARRPGVLATPHCAGLTPDAIEHQAFDTVAQVRALCAGEAPPHAVNVASASRLARLGRERGRGLVSPNPL
jgi:D-3-phosphoglycerate dehydrogenase